MCLSLNSSPSLLFIPHLAIPRKYMKIRFIWFSCCCLSFRSVYICIQTFQWFLLSSLKFQMCGPFVNCPSNCVSGCSFCLTLRYLFSKLLFCVISRKKHFFSNQVSLSYIACFAHSKPSFCFQDVFYIHCIYLILLVVQIISQQRGKFLRFGHNTSPIL